MVATTVDPPDRERIRTAFPDLEVVEAEGPEQILERIDGCEALFTARLPSGLLERAGELRWIQVRSAGVNGYPLAEIARRGIRLTNASGAHGTPIAENILAMMFAFAIRLPEFLRFQQTHTWDRGGAEEGKFELEGQTLLIAGLGGIGGALARKAKGLGLHVLGIRRSGKPVEGVDELLPPDRLMEALPRADHVALCLPLTQETTHYLDEPQLRAMRRTAYVYNVGRGQSIAKEPLLRALREGWIAGAGLDVTDPEPLPPEDPLWDFPNVILTQHTSGFSHANSARVTDIFLDNLRRYRAGEPLRNQVDAARGY